MAIPRIVMLILSAAVLLGAQGLRTGSIRGRVTFAGGGAPVRGASIVLNPGGSTVESSAEGEYVFGNLAPGDYTLLSHMHALADDQKSIHVAAGETVTADFALRLNPLRETLTVTASGREDAVADSFLSVASLDGYQLAARGASASLGDLLGEEAGVAKRSFGPGTTRPVIRGFDGDRVLVLQDGMRTGTISSQSGDHGEPIDPSNIERLEVVKGPATLLYGSNAIGGVVNVLTDHHVINQHPHDGLHMMVTGSAGTANGQGGGSGSFEYGYKNWMIYSSGGGLRTGDYNTPIGRILNSGTDMTNFKTGAGRYGERFSFNANVQRFETTYGIPARDSSAELSLIDMRRTGARFNGAVKQLGNLFEQFEYDLGYTDYTHSELVEGVAQTQFFNKQFTYRGALHQRRRGRLSGQFGFWGLRRDYNTRGAEALAPPVDQNAFAVYGLEELTFERVRFQFGGRIENNRYDPTGLARRSFTGASGSAGVWLPLWRDGALVVNFIHSYRAPALEELYNVGPHPGNLAFEIGNPNLKREGADGVEVALRHQGKLVRAETSLFRYQMHDFVFFSPRGLIQDGLPVNDYAQADARYTGAESRVQAKVAGPLWLLTGVDYVDANLSSAARTNLPRIPPATARAGFDYSYKGLNLRPELLLANRQWQVAPNETPTAGYAVFHLNATYTLTRGRVMHTINVNAFNLGDRLYRNHLSFIKEFAPETGRGVRVAYTVRVF